MLAFNKPTLITITAPTCSGKNFLLTVLQEDFGFPKIVSTTTRARRSGEVEGQDYNFITEAESHALEASGQFAELVTFRGTRYGVTNKEMIRKMTGTLPPVVILEPEGLAAYQKICKDEGWDIFKVYIYTTETQQLERLIKRTISDYSDAATDIAREKVLAAHVDRVQSITGEERRWSNHTIWDVNVPGDDLPKALSLIKDGIAWRNKKNAELSANL